MTRTTAIQRLAVLRKVEWAGCRAGYPSCIVCKGWKMAGHTDVCELAAFIADVEDEVKAARERRNRGRDRRGSNEAN